ncbi:MAG: hypothetical protein GY778_13770, partial [bacterium]|nr:hypothetical protein [bacterium]
SELSAGTAPRVDPAGPRILGHQVGRAHRQLMLESFGLDPAVDYTTLEQFGNTGSVALPITAALGIENGHLDKNDQVALLGIGSGINAIMLGVDWQRSLVERKCTAPEPHLAAGSGPKAAWRVGSVPDRNS